MITKITPIDIIVKHELQNYLEDGFVFSIFINGEHRAVYSYNHKTHNILFDNYTEKNLDSILPSITAYCLSNESNQSRYVFSYEHFLNMAKWKKKSPVVKKGKLVTTKRGFKFYLATENEITIFNRFNEMDNVYDIRGQDLIIPYKGKNGKECGYHPDLIVYFNNGSILLYEAKPVIQMAMHEVLVKYVAMRGYALNHRYMYCMGGVSSSKSQIKTFDDIKKRKPNLMLKHFVDRVIDENGFFDNSDFTRFKITHKLVGKSKINPIYYDLVNLVINNLDDYYMYSKKGKSIHSWRVIRPKFKNTIKL